MSDATKTDAALTRIETPPAVQEHPDPIIALARDTSIDLERVKAIRAMMLEDKVEASRMAFNAAMVEVKRRIPIIVKNAENMFTHSVYASLDAIGEKVDSILAENGIVPSFYPVPGARDGHVKIECVLSHTEGYERRFEAEVPVDAVGMKGERTKTDIHAWRSGTTYARRTLYEMIFDIKSKKFTKDDDGNAAGKAAFILPEQLEELQALIIETGTEPKVFNEAYKIEKLQDLSQVDFGDARARLKIKRAGQKKAEAEGAVK